MGIREGVEGYSIEAEVDMPISKYLDKLAALKRFMKVK